MTTLCVMGTRSCATISIGGFKGDNYDRNEAYKKDKSSFNENNLTKTVQWFRDNILMPISQPVDQTDDYPFQALMDAIDESDMKPKALFAVLNQSQLQINSGYWKKELLRNGFTLIGKNQNNWGSMNYIFVRNMTMVPQDD